MEMSVAICQLTAPSHKTDQQANRERGGAGQGGCHRGEGGKLLLLQPRQGVQFICATANRKNFTRSNTIHEAQLKMQDGVVDSE